LEGIFRFGTKKVEKDAGAFDCRGVLAEKDWFAPAADTSSQPAVDLMLGRLCKMNDDWSIASKCWQSQLLAAGQIMVKASDEPEEAWKFTMAICCAEAALTIPAKVVSDHWSRGTLFYPVLLKDNVNDVDLTFCYDIENWDAWAFRWISPLRMRIGGVVADKSCILAETIAQPEKLLTVAARQCFWQLKKPHLFKLCHHLVVPNVSTSCRVSQLLMALISKVLDLSSTNPEQLALHEILSKRLNIDVNCEILEHEGAFSVLGARDQELARKDLTRERRVGGAPRVLQGLCCFQQKSEAEDQFYHE
jgi:hypothetical protein